MCCCCRWPVMRRGEAQGEERGCERTLIRQPITIPLCVYMRRFGVRGRFCGHRDNTGGTRIAIIEMACRLIAVPEIV